MKIRGSKALGMGLVVGLLALMAPLSHAGQTFNFVFDNSGGPAVAPPSPPPAEPPFVGSGAVTFATDPGIGDFTLDTLGPFTMLFNVGGGTFTQADILTTLSTIVVEISDLGNGIEGLNFTNTNFFGDGPLGGSIDFINANGDQLSFSPPGSNADYLYYEVNGDTGDYVLGVYTAIGVPEPSNTVLMCSGFVFFALLGVRQYRRTLRCKSKLPVASRRLFTIRRAL